MGTLIIIIITNHCIFGGLYSNFKILQLRLDLGYKSLNPRWTLALNYRNKTMMVGGGNVVHEARMPRNDDVLLVDWNQSHAPVLWTPGPEG